MAVERNQVQDFLGIAAITHLGDGVEDHHAATVGQLNAAVAGIGAAEPIRQSFSNLTSWTLDHAFANPEPDVTLVVGGKRVNTTTEYVSPTRVTATFAVPTSGAMTLSR